MEQIIATVMRKPPLAEDGGEVTSPDRTQATSRYRRAVGPLQRYPSRWQLASGLSIRAAGFADPAISKLKAA
ncbi:hypothetical protein [Bradyrhizobium sp. CCGUVB14]|uniref:hypothetical protein n=1 Tax=Bradyrhizobium sp. CCGUVB14 TaxID=2949628 RepID=UPI0020B2DD34|nr:hypothetical protein [Bradyrhizobium sp. CCGUVB14]MCP3440628.1 hypothetical protein [Bradyrhizobium sp. CCGUVB14]